ncbi:hypothetical protein L7F22_012367 [Adiantum nelumboides]|nr:hypothetical protein [Adiantum nelumboides]
MQTHILESTRHEMKYMVAQGHRKKDMPKVVNQQSQKDDKKDIEAALEKLHSLMATYEGWDFDVVEATLDDFKDKRYVRVRCSGRRPDFLTRAEFRKTTIIAKKQARDLFVRLCYIFDAIAEIYQKKKEKHRITSKIPFILVEDEIAIKQQIRWSVKDATLVGLDGYKIDDHECIATCMIKVGEGQKGYDTLFDAFQNCVVGGQWDAISSLWNEKLWPRICMVIGHASDGDSRRSKLMLFNYMDTPGSRFDIPWKGWPLSAKMVDNGIIGLHDQDFVHNGKKLVDVLNKVKRQFVIRDVWITLNHVLILNDAFFIDKHMLREEDIRQDDCQNCTGAQKICSRQVQWCLEELADNGKARKEQSMLGTKYYLEVVGEYTDIFLSQHLNLVEKVHLAGIIFLSNLEVLDFATPPL